MYEVMKAMEADSSVNITALRVDGGMTVNKLLMQFQADICGVGTKHECVISDNVRDSPISSYVC